MKSLTDTFLLHNSVKIPCLGFGTWMAEDGREAVSSVISALNAGYRHIDTATAYQNEASIGEGVEKSGVKREDIFITTKLWNQVRGYDETIAAFNESAKKLRTEYIDLFLIHWPMPIKFRSEWQKTNAESWRAMEDLYNDGKIRSIGVSNFYPRHLRPLLDTARVIPHVNQVRLCPGETQPEIAEYCKGLDILLEAYSPMGHGRIFDVPQMQAFSKKYGKSVAQICIRWCLENGWLPLPKSVNEKRIIENADVFDFELEKGDIEAIAGMTECCGPSPNPDDRTF